MHIIICMMNLEFEAQQFQQELNNGLNALTSTHEIPDISETIKIDLHCHDYNSDKPDELLGRILDVPETWLKSEQLVKTLEQNGCNAITITNHNNARSCWELMEKGVDILPAAEFTCTVPDYNTSIHVLAYGFNQKQEKRLNELRYNVYKFQNYALNHDIPTVWAHPLYFYSPSGVPPIDFFEKTALIFQRFEVINGQRDTWQNLLTHEWLQTFDQEKTDRLSVKYDINPYDYCSSPYTNTYIGGSDSHMGIFAGLTGTRLYVPGLSIRKDEESFSTLALEAIKSGKCVPYGGNNNNDKMATAFLDYVCQIALKHKDPGLLRIFLHKGSYRDKLTALVTTNGFAELRKHKVTMKFIELFHNSFLGKSPHFTKKWFIPTVYKSIFDDTKKIAITHSGNTKDAVVSYNKAVYSINNQLNKVFAERLNEKVSKLLATNDLNDIDFNSIIDKFEVPSELRLYTNPKVSSKNSRISKVNISKFLDGLSFPFLASSLILAANFASAKALYNNRELLDSFSAITKKYINPKRVLWLTDTFEDKNGVSMVLKSVLGTVQERNLPIDILVCSNNVKETSHLKVISPLTDIEIPFYDSQSIKIPNFLEIHKLFLEGCYDRIIVSTEGPMGFAALYLKYAFNIKAYFYMHTDWLEFVKKTMRFDRQGLSRFRRILRAYYGNFDGVFVLNSDHRNWLLSKDINFKPEKVHLTAHWVEQDMERVHVSKNDVFGIDNDCPVILYTGRLSKEKGVDELAVIYHSVVKYIPDLKLVIAGEGPEESYLKKLVPEAIFMGWINHSALSSVYSAADLLLLPSRFDTFSMVVLEALACGLPVIAYNTKGPKDIIENGTSGYLVKNQAQMSSKIVEFFENDDDKEIIKKNAVCRSEEYTPAKIMDKLLIDIKLY